MEPQLWPLWYRHFTSQQVITGKTYPERTSSLLWEKLSIRKANSLSLNFWHIEKPSGPNNELLTFVDALINLKKQNWFPVRLNAHKEVNIT